MSLMSLRLLQEVIIIAIFISVLMYSKTLLTPSTPLDIASLEAVFPQEQNQVL